MHSESNQQKLIHYNSLINNKFEHIQSAHCENGASAVLFHNKGVHISEPMIFGIGSGLFFAHMPFMKLNGMPVTGFRPLPGMIFTRAAKKLGIKMKKVRFRNPEKAMEALDKNLAQGIPTGCVVGVFHLTYFPAPYRVHFNAHNLVVFGKEGDNYLISDPIMSEFTTLSRKDLMRVRFAKGTAPPRGKMYWPVHIPTDINLKKAIIGGIKKTCYDMLNIPLKYFGVKGIRFLASEIRKWPKRMDSRKAAQYLGQVVRMQEEIGTGGAGFRFIYAAFLQECSGIFNDDRFRDLSNQMTQAGDMWREFAVEAARLCKSRESEGVTYDSVADMLMKIADKEEDVMKSLKELIKSV